MVICRVEFEKTKPLIPLTKQGLELGIIKIYR